MEERWIITTYYDNAGLIDKNINKFQGSTEEVKKLLLQLVEKDKKFNGDDGFEMATKSVDEIDGYQNDSVFYAHADWFDMHVDYTALKLSSIDMLELGKV